MPIYTYEAANSMGKKVSASIEAADEEQVKVMLRGQGLVPLSIKASRTRRTFLSKRLTSKDLLLFTQELGNLLKSGLPVDRAIYVLSEHAEKDAMRTVLSEVYADLQRGQALSQALGHHKVFPQLYVNMIRAGELGGTLEEVIQRLAKFLETTVQFQTDITTAMYYPALLVFFGGASVAFIMAFVVPKFAEMFESSGQPLPTATAVLMNISGFFASYWWVMLAALIAAVVLLRSYVKTNEGKLFL
nr:type II secretion system F family protein [Gammaproteobacteria bacterium]